MSTLLPWPRVKFFVNNTNAPLAGGKVYTYAAGTSTPIVTYMDEALTPGQENTNPVILDANGEANIHLSAATKINVLNASNEQVPGYPVDNITSATLAAATAASLLRTDLANDTDSDLGAALVGYTDPVAPAYLKVTSDIINGLEVSMARFLDDPNTTLPAIWAQTNTDDLTSNFTTALNAGDYMLFVPRGLWNVDSELTYSHAMRIKGEGKYLTNVRSRSASANIFKCTSTVATEFMDMKLSASVIRTAGAYIKIDPAAGYQFDPVFRRVMFDSPYIGVDFVDGSDFTVDDCYFASYLHEALRVANAASPDSGDSLVFNSTFDGAAGSAGIAQYSSGGLRVLSNKFLGGDYHYLGQFNTSSPSTSILVFQGNSTESAAISNVALTASAAATFSQAKIIGGQMSVMGGAAGVSVVDPGYDFLDGLEIGGVTFNLATNSTAASIGRGSRVSILPNVLLDNGTGITGFTFGGNVDSITCHPQDMTGIDTPYAGTMTNVTFSPGRRESGTITGVTTGVVYAGLYASTLASVVFGQKYGKAPSVKANCIAAGGGVSVLISNESTTGFDYQVLGVTNGGSCSFNWSASG